MADEHAVVPLAQEPADVPQKVVKVAPLQDLQVYRKVLVAVAVRRLVYV